MDSPSEFHKAILFIALATALWSTGGVPIKTMRWRPGTNWLNLGWLRTGSSVLTRFASRAISCTRADREPV